VANSGSSKLGKGYVQVYTGECKGKTTAALGLALRSAGHGLRTHIGQFMKGQDSGELHAIRMIEPYITIEQYGRPEWMRNDHPWSDLDHLMATRGLEVSRQAMLSGDYDIIVLDEINTACYCQLLSLEAIIDLIAAKPDGVELILTGRYAPRELIAEADLVTEMTQVKHYFHQGVQARDGIER
jgi:cob(I)alamin adenosyltransferase